MQYIALIYTEEQDPSTVDPELYTKILTEYNAFTEAARGGGVMVAGEALQPTSTATTVHVEGDRTITTDGPFAETREALGGFYLLKCKDLDDAIEWAAKIPGARFGRIELRPIVDFTAEGPTPPM
jgi:hypothetical protein